MRHVYDHLKSSQLPDPVDPPVDRLPPSEIALHDALIASFTSANLAISLCHSSLRHLEGSDLSGQMVDVLRGIFLSAIALQLGIAEQLGLPPETLLSLRNRFDEAQAHLLPSTAKEKSNGKDERR